MRASNSSAFTRQSSLDTALALNMIAEFLIPWALGYALSKGTDRISDNLDHLLRDGSLVIELREEVEDWTEQLPDELGTNLDSRSVLGQMFQAEKGSDNYGEAQQRLADTLRQTKVPPVDEWFEALFERWDDVRHGLSAAEAHLFFTQSKEPAEDQLRDLASRLHHVCQQSGEHFQNTITFTIKEIEGKVEQLYDTPWVTPGEYFSNWMTDARLFRHSWTLVGRHEVCDTLESFASEREKLVAILPGRGGVGKSKLLQAFSRKLLETEESTEIRFVSESTEVSETYSESLPEGKPLVIVLDDAHRRSRKERIALLQIVQKKNAEGIATKLILSSRPYKVDTIRSEILRYGFDSTQVEKLERLESLRLNETRKLARQALGPEYNAVVDQLASVGEDSPLVVTVGGLLIKQKRVDPRLLAEESEDFRSIVLEAFRDLFSRNISDRVEPFEIEGVLHLVAALAPVRPADDQFIEEASSFLEMRPARFRTVLHELEKAGAFIRRGGLIRITPDVLSDDILHEVCRTPEGTTTSFANRVVDHFSEQAAERILQNLAEIDWRIRLTEGQSDLLDEIWESLQERYRRGDVHRKIHILSLLEEVAYYLPNKTLRMVEDTILHFIRVNEENNFSSRIENSLANVLQRVAYTVRLLPKCIELLWELVNFNENYVSNLDGDAFSVLKELAKPHYRKPISFQEQVLSAIEDWIAQEDIYGIVSGPRFLDLLDQFLIKIGDEWRREDHAFQGRVYAVQMTERQRDVRARAIKAIVRYGTAEYAEIRDVLEAKESLIDVLRAPQPLYGIDISEEFRQAFEEEQKRAVEALKQLRGHPIIDVELLRSLRWYAQNAHSQYVRKQVADLASDIDPDFEMRLTQSLMYRNDRRNPKEDEIPAGFEDHSEDPEVLRRRTSREFVDKFPNPESAVEELSYRLQELKDAVPSRLTLVNSKTMDPGFFLRLLASENSTYAVGVAQNLVSHPGGPLDRYVGLFILEAQSDEDAEAQILIQHALNNGGGQSESIARIPQLWNSDPEEQDRNFGKQVLQADHNATRQRAIYSLVDSLDAPPDEKISLALQARIDGDVESADKLFSLFNPFHGIDFNQVNNEQFCALLQKLEVVGRIEKHWIQKFLKTASERVPQNVFDLLLKRLQRETREFYPKYRAVPAALLEKYVGFGKSLHGLTESQDYQDMLRQVRDLMIEENRAYSIPDLFVVMSDGINEVGQEVLREWLDNCNPDQLRVILRLIEKAPEVFVLENDGFVGRVLEVAYNIGREHFDNAKSKLLYAAQSGSRTRDSYQPAVQDARNRDRGHELAEEHAANPLLGEFYAELARQAEEKIEADYREDEEMTI